MALAKRDFAATGMAMGVVELEEEEEGEGKMDMETGRPLSCRD